MTAAVYIRKSREDKDKPGHRLTVQRRELPEHARTQGWQVEIYDDGHASAARGKAVDLRERSRLEADIRAGRIDVILCIELSRLSRDDSLQDYVGWLNLCSEYSVKLATTSRILDPAQHSDWMLLLMEGGFSSVEMRVLKKRMEEGRREAYLSGKWLSGIPPIPYQHAAETGALEADPNRLPTFRKMMELAETHSARQVADQTGLPLIAVRRAISDERLILYQGMRLDTQTGETIPGKWPTLIDAEQAERIRANRRAGHRQPRRKITGLLNGLGVFVCGYCGRSIRTWSNGRARKDGTKISYYGCRHLDKPGQCRGRMVPQHVVDNAVITNQLNTLSDLEQIKGYWLDHQQSTPIAEQIAKIEREIVEWQIKKQRLVAAITENVISFADAKETRQQIESALDDCRARKTALAGKSDDAPAWDDLDLTAEDWDLLTLEERRDVLRAAFRSIKMTTSRLTLEYAFARKPDGTRTAEIKLPPPGKTDPRGHWKMPQK